MSGNLPATSKIVKIVSLMQRKLSTGHHTNRYTSLLTLEEIIEGCRRGDADARRELYTRYSGAMYGVICRYITDRQTAEDLLHDGFVTLFTHIGDYRGEGSFEGWCRKIFVNTALNHFRRHNPLTGAEDISKATIGRHAQPTAISELSAAEIKSCIDTLPEGYRTIFNLHAVEEYDYTEIADMLGISEATVRSQYMRARMKLMEIMSQISGGDADIINKRHPKTTIGHNDR